MSGSEDFTRLVLWQKSQQLAADVATLVAGLPRNRAADVIGNQVMRSVGSVPANIAEGYGRFSQPAYRNHLSIARGSLFETESWIDLLHRCEFLEQGSKELLVEACHEVGKLLTLRMKALSKGTQSYAREEAETYRVEN